MPKCRVVDPGFTWGADRVPEPSRPPLPPIITPAGMHNLPLAITRMVGRDDAVAAVVSRLSRKRAW
jgi:hypothetical protein